MPKPYYLYTLLPSGKMKGIPMIDYSRPEIDTNFGERTGYQCMDPLDFENMQIFIMDLEDRLRN